MAPFVATLQVGQSSAPPFALPGGHLGVGPAGGASSRYTSLASGQTMAQWARSLGWDGQQPLVIVAWSAGVFAVRSWLLRGDQAAVPRLGLLLLDGLHGGSQSGACDPGLMAGVVRFAREAQETPSARLLVNTATSIRPPYSATGDCQAYLEGHVPSTSSVQLRSYPGDDAAAHVLQLRDVGPGLMREVVQPWVETGVAPSFNLGLGLRAGVALGVAASLGYAAWVCATR